MTEEQKKELSRLLQLNPSLRDIIKAVYEKGHFEGCGDAYNSLKGSLNEYGIEVVIEYLKKFSIEAYLKGAVNNA